MRSLLTYSLVKALYDRGKDYIDSFWPFVLECLPRDKRPIAAEPLADMVRERFGLTMPVHTVRTLAERAKRAYGLVSRSDGAYTITAAGLSYLEGLETDRQVERRLSALIQHASEELGKSNPAFLDLSFTQAAIGRVIEQNYRVFDFIVERPSGQTPPSAEVEGMVLRYFSQLERGEPAHFDTLRDLILGSTLAGLLKRDDISDATRHFEPTQFFLDTNLLLSILGLRFEVECRPALELLAMLQGSARFSLHVFDFTLEELAGLLRGYRQQSGKYLPDVKVNSLYSSLRFRQITPSDIVFLIRDIEPRLSRLGVAVVQTGVSVAGSLPGLADKLAVLHSYKPDQEPWGQAHDLLAIDQVAKRRQSQTRKVEHARVYFLTEDYKLSNYAFVERGHREACTISEVMPDRLLTNLLWLKSPDTLKSLAVETVIAMHSRDLFIDRRVWERFHAELSRLREEGELPDEDASTLLYDAQVHSDLAALGTGQHRAVSKNWLLDRLEDARRRQDLSHTHALDLQAQALAAERDTLLSEAGKSLHRQATASAEREAALERELERTKTGAAATIARLRSEEKRAALKIARVLALILNALIVGAVVVATVRLAPWVVRRWNVLEPIAWAITIGWAVIIGVTGWKLRHPLPRVEAWARGLAPESAT